MRSKVFISLYTTFIEPNTTIKILSHIMWVNKYMIVAITVVVAIVIAVIVITVIINMFSSYNFLDMLIIKNNEISE